MRTRGAGAAIPLEYQGVTSPFVGIHFTREGQEPDIPAFLSRLWKAPWCFKVVLSPDPAISPTLPMQDVAQAWMQQVEADLGVKLDWIGAVHHDLRRRTCTFSGLVTPSPVRPCGSTGNISVMVCNSGPRR